MIAASMAMGAAPVSAQVTTTGGRVLHLDEMTRDAPNSLLPRYEALDAYAQAQRRPKAP